MATLFRTGHPINERVCDSLHLGFKADPIYATYGVLRGSGEWARDRQQETICVIADNGYFGCGHYEGYYRLALEGTQSPFDYRFSSHQRWQALNLPVSDWKPSGNHILLCPPTEAVCKFYGIPTPGAWVEKTTLALREVTDRVVKVRYKGGPTPLEFDLANVHCVVTFNSAVGWECLQQGIRCLSDFEHSTVGTWLAQNGITTLDVEQDFTHLDRTPLLHFMANRQFTLAEIETGLARSYML